MPDLCFTKQIIKTKSTSCLQCFSSKYVLTKHKEDCLITNGKQSVKLKKEQLNLKIIPKKHQYHIEFMLILSVI